MLVSLLEVIRNFSSKGGKKIEARAIKCRFNARANPLFFITYSDTCRLNMRFNKRSLSRG